MFEFESLFRYRKILARHLESPMFPERTRFLQHCADQGMAKNSLTKIATELLVVAQRLDLSSSAKVLTSQEIDAAAERWARSQCKKGRAKRLRWPRHLFNGVATAWLEFMGRLQVVAGPKCTAGESWILPFTKYSLEERGLALSTIQFDAGHLRKASEWLAERNRTLVDCRHEELDGFLESLKQKGWCRVSLSRSVTTFRTFYRYAESKGWCEKGFADGLLRPRVSRGENLPLGPEWRDIERLICTSGHRAKDIRDKAILGLLAVYGLRTAEVMRLRIDDVNWRQDRILFTRPKQRRGEEYPLTTAVGESILGYLQGARPPANYREIFLTSKSPIKPLSGSAISTMVHDRMKSLGIRSLRFGAHALRHGCAGRLVSQGSSLKQIGDHLGHRSAYSTRVYAKVDLAGLREVADISLEDLT